MKESPKMPGRLRGLDTLRACAILYVMLFHLRFRLTGGMARFGDFGWIGVDLFFVLSGYLIGSQLLRPYLRDEVPSLKRFYRQRAYRILPAYLVVLALYVFVPWWRESPGLSPVWQFLTFTVNLFIDYSANSAFSHAWSLCVEEHFYLLFPLLVLSMMRRPSARKTIGVIVGVVLAGMAVRGWFLFHTLRPLGAESDQFASIYLERIYYPTYSRLDGLLAGVSLALLRTFRPAWWAMVERRGHTLFACGLGLVAFCAWLFADRFSSATGASAWSTVVGFPLLALGLALVVASAISENGLLSRVSVPGARPIAMMAFSIYLTHKEVMHFDDRLFPGVLEGPQWRALAFCFVTCVAVGAVLYLAVERPFLMLRDRKLKGARVEEAHAVHS